MKSRGLTWVLVAGVVLLFVYEFAAAALNTPSNDPLTISQLVWRGSTHPIVPFAFGVLMGHFFWQKE